MFSEHPFRKGGSDSVRTHPGMATGDLRKRLHATFGKHVRGFAKGDTLLFEGDDSPAIYLVFEGWLELLKSLENGQDQIIDLVLPGDIADPVAGDGTTAAVTVRALSDGSLTAIPHAAWQARLADWPELSHAVHLIEAARQAGHAERILRLGKGSAEMRVAYALAEFCIRIEAASDDEIPQFHIPLTQQQLGDYLGLSSVHVCRTMRRMNRKGILEMHDHMDIRILDSHALARLAGVDCDELRREILAPHL